MDRVQLLGCLEQAWEQFQECFAGLSDSELTISGVSGMWSVRDILAHISTWEQEALKNLPIILKGEIPPRYSVSYGRIDAFNALRAQEKRSLPLLVVQRELYNVHHLLLTFLQTVPDQELQTKTRFRRRLRLDTYHHYPKHAEAIRKWRAQTLTQTGIKTVDEI